MKIVVLDGYGLNPGDLSWENIQKLGDVTLFDRTPQDQVIERAKEADMILTNKNIIHKEILDSLPKLKYIGVLATGYNVIDIQTAREKGIVVTNIPAYSTYSVAQMVFAHLLNIANRVGCHAEEVRKGRWANNLDFCFWDTPQREIADKFIGLVGLGHTGMATAQIALAFGMKVLALTSKAQNQLPQGITAVSKEELLRKSDIISLHCPLTSETRHFINEEAIQMMKPEAILINTGRGPLLDEQAVADALNSGRLAAAGLDVLSQEPPKVDNPLITAKNCFITPHIAWATLEARQRLMEIAQKNIEAFLNGSPINNVAQ